MSVVKTYYDVLGIEKTADAPQIKRAYFGLVKKYPPERFPEEFKALRMAYDTLSNEKKRSEYDETEALPGDAAIMLKQAEKATRQGKHAQAAEIYSLILENHPVLPCIQERYARCLEEQGKNGKAIGVWQQLCEQEPDNAEYALELALAYSNRGWCRKAIAEFWRVLKIDDSRDDVWMYLINCYGNADEREDAAKTCLMAIEALKKADNECVSLYAMAVILHVQYSSVLADEHLQNMLRLMRAGSVDWDKDDQELVIILLDVMARSKMVVFLPYVQEMADMIPDLDDDLRERLAKAALSMESETLEEQGFPDVFYDLFQLLDEGCDCQDCRLNRISMELHILEEREICCPQLRRLKQEHPRLYDRHAEFFNQVLTRDPEKMIYARLKTLDKYGVFSGFPSYEEEDYPVQETVRRTEPKVGRNDPCPCGSGKKYKKCCGSGE